MNTMLRPHDPPALANEEREMLVDMMVDWNEGRHRLPAETPDAYAQRARRAVSDLWRVFFSRGP